MNETMTETKQPITDALQTKCKACGGIMQYSPADEDLKCVYCGKSAELDKTAAEIEENDFNYWKDRANENNEDQTVEVSEIKCRQCGQYYIGSQYFSSKMRVLFYASYIKRSIHKAFLATGISASV